VCVCVCVQSVCTESFLPSHPPTRPRLTNQLTTVPIVPSCFLLPSFLLLLLPPTHSVPSLMQPLLPNLVASLPPPIKPRRCLVLCSWVSLLPNSQSQLPLCTCFLFVLFIQSPSSYTCNLCSSFSSLTCHSLLQFFCCSPLRTCPPRPELLGCFFFSSASTSTIRSKPTVSATSSI
jgi:hypothetical protein